MNALDVAPHNPDAETALVAHGLLSTHALAAARHEHHVGPDDVYQRPLRAIWTLMCRAVDDGIDDLDAALLVDLADRLGDQAPALGLPNPGAGRLVGEHCARLLAHGAPSVGMLAEHARIVRDHATRRRLLAVLADLTGRAADPAGDPARLVADAETALLGADGPRDRLTLTAQAAVREQAGTWQEDVPAGIPTGLRDLDDILGGLRAGRLVLLAARPAVGKSAMALQIAHEVTVTRPVLMVSLEMTAHEIAGRLVARRGGRLDRLDGRTARDDDWRHVMGAADDPHLQRLHLADRSDMSAADVALLARRLHARTPLGLVVVDYLQLLRHDGRQGANANERTAETSRRLKVLAADLGIPVLALSQLSRRATERPDAPELSDLRDSGALEQDADQVVFLHCRDAEDRTAVEAVVRKNRGGRLGSARLRFTGHRFAFASDRFAHLETAA